MRILVVDDDHRLATTLKRGLDASGFATDVAADGREALWLARECTYDAIVLDLMLPGPDGHQVCRELRAAGDWTPVLMLTARFAEEEEIHALDSGADDFLPKPFSYAVLLARLRALARRGRPERPTVLHAGDLELDPAARTVRRNGVAVELTARQFSVLEVLVRRKGQVVSKAEILAQVWDFAYEGDPNIVEVFVSQVRRRIDVPFGRHTLTTVRGSGYRLEEAG